RNGYINKVFSPEEFEMKSNSEISFLAPAFEDVINFNVSFPLQLLLGISFNGGFDYSEKPVVYIDKFAQPILTTVYPNIVPRGPYTLTVQGAGLHFVSHCIIRTDTEQTLIVGIKNSTQPNTIYCEIPQ